MKYTFAIAAILAVTEAQRRRGNREIPDEAVGECSTTDDCAADTYCVYSVTRQEDTDPVWALSYCGDLAECEVREEMDDDGSYDSLGDWWNDWFGDENGEG